MELEMPDVGTPSLDQLQVFLTVVEAGSFAAAGRRLRRATSAISYTIAHLERQLGIALFDRERTRRPVLTEAGEVLLSKARAVSGGVDDLRASVKGLLSGLEAEIALVVDVMFPTSRLADAVREFEANFPTVTLRLHVEALGAVTQLVHAGVAGIGIAGALYSDMAGIERFDVGAVEMIPVAAPQHPLARNPPKFPGDARRHRQLVLTVRSPFTESRGSGGDRQRDLAAGRPRRQARPALCRQRVGLHARAVVRHDLASARLVRIDLPEMRKGSYPLQAIYRTDSPPGPAAAWMIQLFVRQAR